MAIEVIRDGSLTIYSDTAAERAAMSTVGVSANSFFKETDGTNDVYEWRGSWVQVSTGGEGHVRTSGAPGTLETRTFTINAATDCVTDTATPGIPVDAELFIADSFTSGKKRARLTWHSQPAIAENAAASEVPHASVVFATLNAGGSATAKARLTWTDSTIGVGNEQSSDSRQRFLSPQNPVIEWSLEGTSSTIDDIYCVAQLPAGTGTIPVYISVEVW